MANLKDVKRYSCPHKVYIPSKDGEWVKFDDIKELLNTDTQQLKVKIGKDIVESNRICDYCTYHCAGDNYCWSENTGDYSKFEGRRLSTDNTDRYAIALSVLNEYHQKSRPFGNADFRGWCEQQQP